MMKCNAYNARDKIRGFYDITFIGLHYWDQLTEQSKNLIKNSFEYKGLEQFDYLLQTQQDELINKDQLVDNFLELYDRIGLIRDFGIDISM